MNSFPLKVVQIKQETKDAVTLCFKQPTLRKIKYQAGQYLALSFRINGRKFVRSYSLSSSPSVDSLLEVTIKRVPNGIVSNYINDYVKVEDTIEVTGPMGDFTFDSLNSKSTIYLWGVGSGITPLFSLIKEIIKTQTNTKIHLILGNKLIESSIFLNQLLSLQQENGSVFRLTQFYSQGNILDEENDVYNGRINSTFVSKLLSQNANYLDSSHYICGPVDFNETVISSLLEMNIPSTSVFTEDFHLVIDPKDLLNVQECKVSLLYEGVSTDLYIPKGKSVLEIALDNRIEIPYSCQIGDCNICKGVVRSGKLKMLGLKKENKDLAEDEFLLCCSYPLTRELSLEVK
ncbi:MAG: iron-sulfur cluster-binding domain-containing protein [Bacteroidetes bacterium]|nr:iron-sulfur cluster-binding domain-containing protein [Bacteroidota bacterium]